MPLNALPILWRNDDYVAINKPAGLATIPGRGESDNALEHLAAQLRLACTGAADPRVRVVHRLDKDTSGVLLFATNSAAQRHASHQFQNNQVRKEYLALVVGRPLTNEGEVDAPIARHPTSPQRMAVVRHGGRPARTEWRVEVTFRGMTLLRVFPKTGKTHQIRVHLQLIGLPLVIDPLYHPAAPGTTVGLFLSSFKRDYRPTAGERERPLIGRLTLHAERLVFTLPDGHPVELIASLPKDFRATLNQLRRHSGG